MVKAYCVKCKVSREIKNPVELMAANGRGRIAGVCPVCGTKMGTFISEDKASPALRAKMTAYKKKKGGSKKSKRSQKSRKSRQ